MTPRLGRWPPRESLPCQRMSGKRFGASWMEPQPALTIVNILYD